MWMYILKSINLMLSFAMILHTVAHVYSPLLYLILPWTFVVHALNKNRQMSFFLFCLCFNCFPSTYSQREKIDNTLLLGLSAFHDMGVVPILSQEGSSSIHLIQNFEPLWPIIESVRYTALWNGCVCGGVYFSTHLTDFPEQMIFVCCSLTVLI